MRIYKVGDVVKLRDDLEINKKYGGITFTNYKNEFKNESMKVIEISEGDDTYRIIDEYNNAVWISEEMIEGLWEECKPKLKLIDILNEIANKVKYLRDTLVRGEDHHLLEDIYLNEIREECELIEPQEPTECEHEWKNYGMYNPNTGETKDFRKCAKCDLEEEIKPTDNTKIKELIEWKLLIDGTSSEELIQILWDKLNEVIRYINKENNNE